MSGATAAHASYNGSGTQGLAVTNRINDVGDIMSVFWNKDKTTKQLLHGSSIIEIPSSGDGATAGSNLIFTLNSDMDLIGDLFLTIKVTPSASITVEKEYGLLGLIDRVEFQVGTQIWQTLEYMDILGLNSTELSPGAYEKFILGLHGSERDGTYVANDVGVTVSSLITFDSVDRFFIVKLPLLTRTIGPMLNNYSNITEGGFLTAAAPNQTVKIKVYTNKLSTMGNNHMLADNSAVGTTDIRLYGKHIIMCNEEREQIRNMPGGLTKRVKISQNKEEVPPAAVSGISSIEIDCDHFSLYASHLIIQILDDTDFSATAFTGENVVCTLLEAELKLNSTSYCGKLKGGLLTGVVPESMGLYVNQFSSRSAAHIRTFTYVFPLANRAYSGSGVPLNRFDNIRLALKISCPLDFVVKKVCVTCVGETTAMYRQGAASISMY